MHSDTIRFDGRVAIVTGGGGGLGRSHAMGLADRGAAVVVNDTGGSVHGTDGDRHVAERVAEDIRRAGGRALADTSDISTPEGAAEVAAAALREFGRIDVLINNAGIIRDKTFAKMPLADFETVLRVHLLGTVYVTKAVFPTMCAGGYGRIVVTTSAVGLYGNFGQTNYGAAKLGVVGFMNSLALEGRKYGVTVNAIAPLAATRMSDGIFPEDVAPDLAPECVTAAVLYLASESCSRSGDVIAAGGGYFARAAIVESPGIVLADVTPEAVAERYDDIVSLTGARPFADAPAEFDAAFRAVQQRARSVDGS